jgi:hypothetical protein
MPLYVTNPKCDMEPPGTRAKLFSDSHDFHMHPRHTPSRTNKTSKVKRCNRDSKTEKKSYATRDGTGAPFITKQLRTTDMLIGFLAGVGVGILASIVTVIAILNQPPPKRTQPIYSVNGGRSTRTTGPASTFDFLQQRLR